MISFKACAWIAYTVDFDATPNELIEKLKKFKFALPDQNEMEFILNKLDI